MLRRKLQLGDASIGGVVALVEDLTTEVIDAPSEVESVSGDPDDDRIIAAATAAAAEVLVTGDRKHVLPLGRVGTMRIVRPQDLLAELAD